MKKYYEAYYMMTALCNLSCSYCVLENSPLQLSQELPLERKKELIMHLYNNFNVRALTISGGEPLCIGNNAGLDFISLMEFLKQLKSDSPKDNLVVKMYSNGLLMTDDIVASMQGVVDSVSINIDSCDDSILQKIGRTNKRDGSFFCNAINSIQLLYKNNIKVKLHTVVSALNYNRIAFEAKTIYMNVKEANPLMKKWKFYQYMSYDNPAKDIKHVISIEDFRKVCDDISVTLDGCDVKTQFKSVEEMNESLFNILATGIAQYRRDNDTWSTTKRTKSLFDYKSMDDMLTDNGIQSDLFDKYHLYNILEK